MVEVRGVGFATGLQLTFGDAAATDLQVVDRVTLRATTTAHAAGLVDVTATLGDDSATLPDGFEYVSGPLIDAIQPGWGPTTGGTAIVVTGAGFAEGAVVRLDAVEAWNVKWMDEGAIQAVTPPGSVGFADVTVENPDGQSDILEAAFEYQVGSSCRVVATTPTFGADDVTIVDSLRVEWNRPISLLAEADIRLEELGTAWSVPFTIELDGDRAILVHPTRSLHFWQSYTLIVGDTKSDAVQARDGNVCAPVAVAFSTVRPEEQPRALRPAAAVGVALSGPLAITASLGYRGLQVYDVSVAAEARLIADLVTEGSPVSVAALGNRVYAPLLYDGVLIADITDPLAPVAIGRAGSPGTASDAAPFEREGRLYLAVADGAEGVRLLDVTDAEGVRDLGAVDPSGVRAADSRAVDVEGDLLAIAEGNDGLILVDIADIGAPVILGRGTIENACQFGCDAADVLLDGDVAYVAMGFFGVYSFDIADRSAPSLVANAVGPGGICQFACVDSFRSISIDGGDLFAAMGPSGAARFALDGAGGMTLSASVIVEGSGRAVVATSEGLFVGGGAGLSTFARDAATGDAPIWFDPRGHGRASGVATVGSEAYVAAGTRGLHTFVLNDPLTPEFSDRDDGLGLPSDLGVSAVDAREGLIAIADGRAGLGLFDATLPTNPAATGGLPTHDRLNSVLIDRDTVYGCADNAGIVVIDVSDPTTPVEIALIPYRVLDPEQPPDQCYSLAISGGTLYVGSREVLSVVDISNPVDVQLVGRVRLRAGDAITSVSVAGTFLLAATIVADFEARFGATHRLQVFDVLDPHTPKRVWVSEDIGAVDTVAVGDVAFVSAADGGVHVFDIFDPATPILQGTVRTAGNAVDAALGSEAVYVAQREGGLGVIRTRRLPAP